MPILRPARPEDAKAMTDLALRSKAHWGYPPEQMRTFTEELTFLPADLERGEAHVIDEGGSLLGLYTLEDHGEGNLEIGHLFIDPDHLREGLGSELMRRIQSYAVRLGFKRLVVLSDPNAEGFYRSHRAKLILHLPSSIPGRTLPLLEITVDAA